MYPFLSRILPCQYCPVMSQQKLTWAAYLLLSELSIICNVFFHVENAALSIRPRYVPTETYVGYLFTVEWTVHRTFRTLSCRECCPANAAPDTTPVCPTLTFPEENRKQDMLLVYSWMNCPPVWFVYCPPSQCWPPATSTDKPSTIYELTLSLSAQMCRLLLVPAVPSKSLLSWREIHRTRTAQSEKCAWMHEKWEFMQDVHMTFYSERGNCRGRHLTP